VVGTHVEQKQFLSLHYGFLCTILSSACICSFVFVKTWVHFWWRQQKIVVKIIDAPSLLSDNNNKNKHGQGTRSESSNKVYHSSSSPYYYYHAPEIISGAIHIGQERAPFQEILHQWYITSYMIGTLTFMIVNYMFYHFVLKPNYGRWWLSHEQHQGEGIADETHNHRHGYHPSMTSTVVPEHEVEDHNFLDIIDDDNYDEPSQNLVLDENNLLDDDIDFVPIPHDE
jgi:hypothetical protein